MNIPSLTTSELASRMKQLDYKLLHCLDEFTSDTGIEITDAIIHWKEDDDRFEMSYAFAFPEE